MGSFNPQLAQNAVEQRAQMERDLKLQAEKKEEKKESVNISDVVKQSMPEKVLSSIGEITYDEFKDIYKDVYESVKDKQFFMYGYCTHTVQMGNVNIVVRTLRRRENDAIMIKAPKTESEIDKMIKVRTLRLMLGVVSIDDTNMSPKTRITADNIDAWEKSEEGLGIHKIIDDWSDTFATRIHGIILDVERAYDFALMESMLNPK